MTVVRGGGQGLMLSVLGRAGGLQAGAFRVLCRRRESSADSASAPLVLPPPGWERENAALAWDRGEAKDHYRDLLSGVQALAERQFVRPVDLAVVVEVEERAERPVADLVAQ